ncbi:MAG: hypothetical protein ACI9JY_001804 [Saprospiraceae bacterium]|jgi:hypothetical protein
MKHSQFIHKKTVQLLAILGIILLPNFLTAQCSFLAFNNDLQISVGLTCEAIITKDVVLENDQDCPDDVTITLSTMNGVFITSGTNQATLPSGFEGTTIQITIAHPNGLNGTTNAVIEDKIKPFFTQCDNITIDCTTPVDPAAMAAVIATDNCDAAVTLNVNTVSTFGPNCSGGTFIYSIIKEYTAVDNFGNDSTCVQTILIDRPDLSQVVFPAGIAIDCGQTADVSLTGMPLLNGNPIDNNGFCNFVVSMEDDIASICAPGGFQILREWRVFNWCTNTEVTETQIINVEDTTAPIIICPEDQVVSTDPGLCSTTVTLPQPTATDDCSNVTFSVNTSYGQTNFNPFSGLGLGTFTVTYTATDGCNNPSVCTINLTVEDNEEPISVCDEITNVSLSSNGMAEVNATVFDDGSFDNCSSVYFEVQRDMTDFSPTVTFDCNDVGNMVMVVVKVTENLNPNSFAICMVSVDVEDALPPVLACPIDMTVDCDNDFTDLSVFGAPTFLDNCNATLSETSNVNLTNCGTGSITRTFTATDDSNNTSNCTQMIMVENQTPFDGLTIQFPPDYELINACIQPDQLDPADLPTSPINYSMPEVNSEACAMIATSFQDQLFTIAFPACYKIVRTWSVIDWCTYDAMNPAAGGIWTSQQIIKLLDTTVPVVTACPADITVGVGTDCMFGTVNVSSMNATDCSPNLTYTNDSPFATGNGANVSGQYPLGIQNVTISVEDGCGNLSNCQVEVTVADLNSPALICDDGIVVELQQMTGGIMAMTPVFLFEEGTTDNCTDYDDLVFTIRRASDLTAPTATVLTFDCNDEGNTVDVQMWVTDQSGNSDFCQTFVEVQDNMNLCPNAPLVAGIQGEIETEMAEEVEEVSVMISSNSNALPDMTGLEGSFAVPDLPLGQSYTVVPEKDIDAGNGVTTFDLVKLSKHILDIQLLDSPYKVIAADVNNSGHLTTLDLVHMRKLILQVYDEFPGNTSWRFVDKDYAFANPENPLNEDYPEIVTVENLTAEGAISNFYGIKIGDLNNSAIANNLLGADDRSFTGEINLSIDNQAVKKGETVTIPFKATDFKDIIGYQFSLEFEENLLEFVEMQAGELKDLTTDNFGFTQLQNGIVTSSWHTTGQPALVDDGKTIFYMEFKALADVELKDIIRINSAATVAEGYNVAEELLDIRLQFNDAGNTAKAFELLQNRPNPFAETTEIGFYLPNASSVNLTVFDLSGKVLKTYAKYMEVGHHKMKVDRADLPAMGVLYYRLETAEDTATRKMVVIK